ncbi:hypothetical protein [Kiloniella sp.]|uniref:hypothetical protein n=1 Tax=Kiloniella sp. TaxID=1938587 RepID=UPI003B01DD63
MDLTDIPESSPVYFMATYFTTLLSAEKSESEPLSVPFWTDFDPIAIRKILPWTMVMERNGPSPEGHVIKLEGQRIVEASGVNTMGKSLAEAFDPEMANAKWEEMEMVAQKRCPSFTLSPVPRAERAFIDIYRGCFPFCDVDGNVNRLVVIVAPVDDKIS